MLKKVKGMVVIHLYDKDGNEIREFAEIAYDEINAVLFWFVFAVIFIPGCVVIGHWA